MTTNGAKDSLDITKVDSYVNKTTKLQQDSEHKINWVLELLEQEKESILNEVDSLINNDLISKMDQYANDISSNNKEALTLTNKLYKEMTSNFIFDFNKIVTEKGYEQKERIVLNIIADYFIRQGYFESARIFEQEANIVCSSELKQSFEELHTTLAHIKNKNLAPAIEWAKQNREFLKSKASNLDFNLHKLNFIMHYKQFGSVDALKYAMENFEVFKSSHFNEIQKLMGMLSFHSDSPNSPYNDIAKHNLWPQVEFMFARDFCNSIHISHESPLYITISAGTIAYPKMMKMIQHVKREISWSEVDELQVVADLLDSWKFHSIFICPVDKVPASEENPPMMMSCGHVVTKDALHKLAKGKTTFKCPYCPSDLSISKARRIYF